MNGHADPSSSMLGASTSTRGRQLQVAPKPVPALDLPALQNASRVLQDQLLKDTQTLPDLNDLLTVPGVPSSASYSVFPDDFRVPFQKRRLVGIPEGLFQYYTTTSVTSHMGLMPQMSYAIGVSTTPATGPNNRPRKEIKMYATDMAIPSDMEMTSVIGTEDGRIFMCGVQDGALRVHYQEKEGWFGKRSLLPRLAAPKLEGELINCFYGLTTKNTIWYTNKRRKEQLPIISLHVIDTSEARSGVQLMAVTTNGVRLYFAPSSGFYSYNYASASGTPTSSRPLQLMHVRLPPSNLLHPDEQSNPYRPLPPPPSISRPYIVSALENSCYDVGLTVAAQPGDVDGTDFVLCMSPDLTRIGSLGQLHGPPPQQQNTQYANTNYGTVPGPSRPPLTEHATLLSIPGRTWGMAPVPRSSSAAAVAGPSGTPAPVFSEPTRQFMILTNVGLTFLAKRRSLDYLKDGNAQPLLSSATDQTCAMLLAIASGNTFLDQSEQSLLGSISTVSPEIAMVAKQAFYDFGERPMWSERVTYGTSTEGSGTAIFSGRREGLTMYFARLVRPFWKANVTTPGAAGLQHLSVPDDVLVTAQKNLFALKELLDTNPQLFHSAPGDHTGARSTTVSEQEAWKAEQSSVSQLMSLLGRTIEAISFILLLSDHRLGELIRQCEPDVQRLVTSMTFEDLITDEKGIAASRALVNVVINQQIGQQISVDTVSEVLQQRCGSFCSTDDVMLYKARENIRKAIETRNPAERQTWLGESLKLFMKGARNLDFEGSGRYAAITSSSATRKVSNTFEPDLLSIMQTMETRIGAVELPLHCAQAYDADGQGHEHWHAGALRMILLVLDSLSVFEQRCNQQNISDETERVRSHAYELAFEGEDEMFHSTLYDWLIERGMADELLEMRPAYLEAHLRRHPLTVQKLQLLWQFYVKDGQPLRAAEVLAALAESTDFDLPLDARLTRTLNTLMPHFNDQDEVGEKARLLSQSLMSITELYQEYAVPFDLPAMQLLILHVSEHRDEGLVCPIWNRIFEEAIDNAETDVAADHIVSKVVPLGQRFYPSESAFPLRHVSSLLVRFSLAHKGALPYGWAPRILVQCGVPYPEVWDILYEMYESQIPPFNEQANVQSISLAGGCHATTSAVSRSEFPVYRVDQAVDQYTAELDPSRTETKAAYENIKRQLRRNW
ncbi:Non-repetitive/WGA-negative nucleoporin C-terminal-domain-containing protein [Fomitopsis serialis]|uniref:Non-repetitive/WGA-negative nucleoporin C-terminal-domain-containing protein n=1 Tax=Fomitopsis serialis TaxID=139415 RepID=UPI0020081678|nr:Non-repetitive/WGA-negative nucleoporin C-terminal-domain-containing protein [Neoantrodia serialis]KAH9937039.1 Non-repetitive/WGA-negative nucleoporin C-terminal-domain-containing protein [Neoantrodia serialis]